jgi:hypothetical protein
MEKKSKPGQEKKLLVLLVFSLVVLAGSLFFLPKNDASAKTTGWWDESLGTVSNQLSTDECLSCHQLPEMLLPLADGEELYLTVDPDAFADSVHGLQDMGCVDCHPQITDYPHPEFEIDSRREVSIQLNQVCMGCHTEQSELYAKGRHAQEFVKGNHETALCVDCHTPHEVKSLAGDKIAIAKTCQKCHADIYDIYKDSVHGTALLNNDNFDVPTCTNCHEYHDNTGPGDAGFVLFSPQICQNCHGNEALMSKYGVRTDVFETYVADFHGATVTIFEKISPDQQTNKPVCIDCHGVHDILSPDNENSSVMKANLLDTCLRCHPDATSNFSDAWLGHYIPDINHNPLVYMVNLFYYVIIPGTMGGIILFIGTDIWRTVKAKRDRSDGGKNV